MNSNQTLHFDRFTLDCGAMVCMEEMVQWRTYVGLLIGVPNEEMNQRRLENAKKQAGKKLFGKWPVHLITPKVSIKSRVRGSGRVKTYPMLPANACAATFDSDSVKKAGHDGSMLKIVWFQDDWAFPVAPEIFKKIRALPWSDLAKDYVL